MGYKTAIVVLWLLPLLAGLLLLRVDYERYRAEVDQQVAYAQARQDELLRYTAAYEAIGRAVQSINDRRSREQWEDRFAQLDQQRQQDEAALGPASLSHLPQSRQALDDAAKLLDQRHDQLRDASRLQDMLALTQGGLDDLSSQAFNLQGAADYYMAVNAWPAYMMIQDELARIEQQLRNRQMRGVGLSNEVTIALGQASGYRDEVLKAAGSLPGKLAQDQKRTYRQDLAERFSSFDLRKTLQGLIQAAIPAQAAPGS